eukprot:gene7847-12320_t
MSEPQKVVVKPRKRKQNIRQKDDEETTENPPVQIVKKTKTQNSFTTSTKKNQENTLDIKIQADREIKESDQGATATDTIDGDYLDKQRAKIKKQNETSRLKKMGPTRGNSTMRATIAFDYKPDICKDYFETGYCGYGDGCKFAHIREDYKSGWEIDKEHEDQLKKQKEEESKKEKEIPFACFICRKRFVDPVVTKCLHYFCEKCALTHYDGGKNTKCAICKEQTFGVFNTAYEIIRKMKKEEEEKLKPKEEWKIDEKERKYDSWAIQ